MFRERREDQLWNVLSAADRVADNLSGLQNMEEDLPTEEEAYVLDEIEQHINNLRNEIKKALIVELKA